MQVHYLRILLECKLTIFNADSRSLVWDPRLYFKVHISDSISQVIQILAQSSSKLSYTCWHMLLKTLSNWNKHILWWHKTMWCFQVSTNSIVFLWVNVWDKQTGLWLTKALFPVLLHSHVDYRRGSGQSQNVKLSKYMISPTKSRWQQSQ